MVLNAAVQMLREADELKQKILKFKNGTSMLQEHSLWITQQQLQKIYQKVLVLDLDYALDKKVEQDLWNVGFKQQIEALQAISKDRKNPLRSEGQAMLSWVLQAAAGFYLCLLHQICTTFKLDLPFRRRASLLGWVEGWGASEMMSTEVGARLPAPAAARYICQHCLVHLGDLQRYRHQPRSAHSFYRHALVVSVHSGQPYNQLALVAWRRGRRLGAVYWHVRALLVRAPFPPAADNLARTLRAAASRENTDLPVIPGVTDPPPERTPPPAAPTTARLDTHAYVTEFIRAINLIYTVEELDTASALVDSLNSSLTALIATDSFESMTLIKMWCVIVWAVQWSSGEAGEGGAAGTAVTADEERATQLATQLAAAALLSLLLPAYTRPHPPPSALPALKVWLQWLLGQQTAVRSGAWAARPQLWPALAHTLTRLAQREPRDLRDKYDSVPLPEDEELHGFLPLEESFKGLRFANHATWDTYGGRVPDIKENNIDPLSEVSSTCLSNDPELEHQIRAHRLVQLGKLLADQHPDYLSYTEDDGSITFAAPSIGGEQLSRALAELSLSTNRSRGETGSAEGVGGTGEDSEADSDDEHAASKTAPPPIIISEADFREKVRDKRVGILKPQGSLERAREERALANSQEDQDIEIESVDGTNKGDDKREVRKPRVNIAMAAIMRKQEETNKQVKFITPPPTTDSLADTTDMKNQDKPKVIQPKPIKSLANLPIGRKTGGILSLKDKSAGYPHLVNAETETAKKSEREDKKEPKQVQSSNQNSQQNYQQKQLQQAVPPNWNANLPPKNFNDQPRMGYQKNYGIQNIGLSYNPNYQAPAMNNQGIRLPVVNPKEIDVRTAALQKQNSRQELFPEGQKFGNHSYQVSGDKKNFLNDLPPRFANQYRYWQTAQENRFNDNKFRDEGAGNSSQFPQQTQQPQQSSWMNQAPMQDQYQQPVSWWKPENPPQSFNYSAPPLNMPPNFYSHPSGNVTNPYQNMTTYNPMLNQNLGQNKPDSHVISPPSYLQSSIRPPPIQNLQNLVASPNFNSSLSNFNPYTPSVGYDSSMYPQFNNKLNYQPSQLKLPDKPAPYQGNKDLLEMGGLSFGSTLLDSQQQNNHNMKFNDLNEYGAVKNLEQNSANEMSATGESSLNPLKTYSLFSGTDTRTVGPYPQSLWLGPGPSPLERLLEQQKQMKPPSAPQ